MDIRINHRLLPLLLAIALVAGILSGCGSQAASAAPAESAASAPEVAEPAPEPESASAPEEADVPEPEASAEEAPSVLEEAAPEESTEAEPAKLTLSEEIDLAATGTFIDRLMDFPYAEETALPVTDEDITFTYFMRTQPFMMAYGGEVDYSDLTFYKEWQERTGVKLDMRVVGFFEVSEKFQLMVASGDYANMMECVENFTGGPGAAIEQEVVYPLEDVLNEYMPNYAAWLDSNEDYRRACSSVEGDLYLCGYLEYGTMTNSSGGLINQGWLDAVGMEPPTTYDEMHDVLTAFRDNGHPGALWMTNALEARSHIYASGYDLSLYQTPFLAVDGKAKSCYTDPDMLDYVTMLHQWYEEGLIYPDFINVAAANDTIDTGLVTGETVGVYSGSYDTAQTMMRDSGVMQTPFPNLRKNPDQQLHVCAQTIYQKSGVSFGTTLSQDEIPIAAKMVDYLYSKDGVILSNFGVEGEGLEFDENGNPRCSDLILNNPDFPMAVIGIVIYSKYGGPGINFAPREYTAYDEDFWNACRVWNENLDNDYELPFYSIFTTEEQERRDNLMSDIQTYVDENLLKFVIGDKPLSEWDDYVNTINSLGMEEVMDLYQTALDRYQAA